MDRTITRGPTWTPWLLFWLRHEAPWRALLLPLLLLALLGYALRLFDRGMLKSAMQRLVMGSRVARDRVSRAAARHADAVQAGNVRAGALARIAADRAEGFRILLATASCHFYVDGLAAAWGIEDVVATRNRWEGDMLLPALDGPNCYAEAKAALVRRWLADQGIDLGACEVRAYSDHISDLPLFALADEAVAANPSRALRDHAQAAGWRIEDWP
ncbi:HAD-IB family phosphatase [Sandaracinobacteroides saxicola]|uniref:HAD-IB family phosphatase n=2 Tax=Sandaracinobacteroides saxicola TaxID=2759707 RepID=A0A7G5IM73_9SPHN|nr:HAD-IB family phosphatase [Sandaracinobacteroides saxicola]